MVRLRKKAGYQKVRKSPNQYKIALRDPFNTQALGVRIPDLYSFPTSPYHAKGTFTVKTDANGNVGLILIPNPVCSVGVVDGTIPVTSMYAYTNSPGIYGAALSSNIRNVFSNFRVVACGFKVRNLIPALSVTGKMIAAPVLISGETPGPEMLSSLIVSTGVNNLVDDATGLGNGLIDTAILNLPGSHELSQQELMAGEIELCTRPVTARAFEFHSTSDAVKNNSSQEFTPNQVFTSANGATTVVADTRSWVDQTGFSGFLVHFSGAPALTNVAEIEYIFHMEGTPPAINAGSLVTGEAAKSHVDVRGYFDAIQEVATVDNIKYVVNAGMQGISALRGAHRAIMNEF